MSLTNEQKSAHYEMWTREPSIGGVLSHYMELARVRVYIKDTLLKDYTRQKLANGTKPLAAAGVLKELPAAQGFAKPHGVRLHDGRIVCWGKAEDWKDVLTALHERGFPNGKRSAAVLLYPSGRFKEKHIIAMVEDAARKLEIERVLWVD